MVAINGILFIFWIWNFKFPLLNIIKNIAHFADANLSQVFYNNFVLKNAVKNSFNIKQAWYITAYQMRQLGNSKDIESTKITINPNSQSPS